MAAQGLPKTGRLLKTDEFSSVFSLRRRQAGHYLELLLAPNDRATARLGLVVSKRVSRLAVARNYQKRVVREWFRAGRATLPGVDIVVRVRRPFGPTEFATVREEYARLLARALA